MVKSVILQSPLSSSFTLCTTYIFAFFPFPSKLPTRHKTELKGQCHELVVEMSPWSSSLGLKWSRTLFSV
jgi:hypothetical protein